MPVAFVGSLESEGVSIAAGATATLTTSSFTPAANELIVIKVATGDKVHTVYTPTLSNGLTPTLRVTRNTAASTTGNYIFTAQQANFATVGPGATTVSVQVKNNFGSSTSRAHLVVERYSGAYVSPAATGVGLSAAMTTASATAAVQATMAQTVVGSMISWTFSDWNGRQASGQTMVAANTITQTIYATGPLVSWNGYYTAPATGTATRTLGMSAITSTAGAVARSIMLVALEIAPGDPPVQTAPKLSTLTDRFSTLDAAKWPTRNFAAHDAKRGAASVQATMTGGTPNYAAWRGQEAFSFGGPATFSFRVVLAPSGGVANAQAWVKQPDAAGVSRIGFELRVTATGTFLDFLGQGPGYAALGTTVSVTYDQYVHRWWMVEVQAAGHLVWYTSPDGVTWTVQRSVAVGDLAAWVTTMLARNDLAASFEGFRSSGTSSSNVNVFVVDDVNLAPEAPPAFAPVLTGGATTFAPDFAATDNVAAGYTNDSWQRQNSSGVMNDPTVPYPVAITGAPYGRSGRAMPFRVPDSYRRYEVVPPTAYADGETWYVGFSFLVEGDMDRVAQQGGYYQILWQLHHAPDTGSPPIGFEVRDSSIIIAGGANRKEPTTGASAGTTYRYEKYVSTYGNVIPGRWIDVVMGIGMWSAPNSGRLDLWLDGVKHLDNYVPKCGTNIPGDGDLAYPKHGIYHSDVNRGATVWFADYREGTSYDVVAPPAGKVSPFGDVIAEP